MSVLARPTSGVIACCPVPTKRETQAEITRILRALRTLSPDDRERRTLLLRDLGQATVDLREHFLTPEGQPDWSGRSGEYKAALLDAYSDAGYRPDEQSTMLKSARYHVANVLRLRLSPDELRAMGMRPETLAQRQAEIRDRRMAIVDAASAQEGEGTPSDAQEQIAYLRGVLATLGKIRPLPLTVGQRASKDHVKNYRQAKRLLDGIITRSGHIIRNWPPPPGEDAEPAQP